MASAQLAMIVDMFRTSPPGETAPGTRPADHVLRRYGSGGGLVDATRDGW
jgi:hypothetical protein